MSSAIKKIQLLQFFSVVSIIYLLSTQLVLQFFFENHRLILLTKFSKLGVALFAISTTLLFWCSRKNKEATFKVSNPRIILLVILILGLGLRGYKLGLHNFYEDEHQVIGAAKCYFEIRKFCQWDWIQGQPQYAESGKLSSYQRAWPHTWLISQSYNLFGVSEASSRIPSVIFGGITILLVYGLTLKLTSIQAVALSVAFLTAIHPEYIFLSRYARMYALLIPIFLVQVWLAYNLIEAKWRIRKKLFFSILLLLLTILNLLIHINSLTFSLGIWLYLLLSSVTYKNNIYRYLFILTTIVGGLGISVSQRLNIDIGRHYLTLFSNRNFAYFNHLFDYPLSRNVGLVLLVMAVLYWVKHKSNKKLLYLVSLVISNLIFFVFVADRYDQFNYIAHVTPLALILVIWSLYNFQALLNYRQKIVILSYCASFVLLTNWAQIKQQYIEFNGRPNYSAAYQEIVNNYEYEKDTLYLQFPRTYYLQELDKARIINLGTDAKFSLEEFKEELAYGQSGWLGWAWYKRGHVDYDIREYAEQNFKKIHGLGVDETGVEIYYYEVGEIN